MVWAEVTPLGILYGAVLLAVVLGAGAWLPALLMVAACLQAASVLNVNLALITGNEALGVYGITPWNATALCAGVVWLLRLVRERRLHWPAAQVLPLQWGLAYALVAVAGAWVLPRVFAGTTVHEMLSLYGMSKPPVPVQWTLSNAVQAANLGVHGVVLLYLLQSAQDPQLGRRMVAGAMTGLTLVLMIGLYQRLSWAWGWPSLSGFWMSNPGYALMPGDVSAADIVRVASPFSEPSYTSSYLATTTLALMAVAAFGRKSRWGLLWGSLSCLGLFNTLGSTGWAAAGLVALVMVFWMGARASVLDDDQHIRTREALIWLVLFAVLVATLVAAQMTRYSQDIDQLLNALLLSKNQPGNEAVRHATNLHALQIVRETWGLGVGLGSNRASSFAASLVSNTGVPGALLFAGMLTVLLWRYFRTPRLRDSQIFAGVALLTATVAVVLGIPDLNLPMYWSFVMLAVVLCPPPMTRKHGLLPVAARA